MRNFSNVKRVVVKVGTNLLRESAGGVDTRVMTVLARQIAHQVQTGKQVILVTSGAIGMGKHALGITGKVNDVKKRQALAAVGQGILMHEYQKAFAASDQKVAQVLLTNRIMSQRKYYVNLKNAMETLLTMGIVPIVNENDCVSIEEIGLAFGDNDKLSALVASKIDAGLLLILTDVDGLYDRNPRQYKNAQRLSIVPELTPHIRAMAGKPGSDVGTGGMVSKLNAIEIAANGGCRVVLADGRVENVIGKVIDGEDLGTLFLPKRRLSNRKRWIMKSQSEGTIEVDEGAARAMRQNRSLLGVGITGVKGNFNAGDVVTIGIGVKGVSRLSSDELRELLRTRQRGQAEQLKQKRAIVHANDMVVCE